jgi:hypothetical protein
MNTQEIAERDKKIENIIAINFLIKDLIHDQITERRNQKTGVIPNMGIGIKRKNIIMIIDRIAEGKAKNMKFIPNIIEQIVEFIQIGIGKAEVNCKKNTVMIRSTITIVLTKVEHPIDMMRIIINIIMIIITTDQLSLIILITVTISMILYTISITIMIIITIDITIITAVVNNISHPII